MLMFSTLILYYLTSVKREKINYLFVLVLLLQGVGDLFFVEKELLLNYTVGLCVYFTVNLLMVLMLATKIKKKRVAQTRVIISIAFALLALFIVFLLLAMKSAVIVAYALMMILLVYSAYHYYTLYTQLSSFLMLFGTSAYLVCNIAASLGVFMMFNFYFMSIQVVAYTLAMYCITSALIAENQKNIFNNDIVS